MKTKKTIDALSICFVIAVCIAVALASIAYYSMYKERKTNLMLAFTQVAYQEAKENCGMRRAIGIEGTGVELELSKVTSIKTKAQMIHLDQLQDGTWRLIYNENLITDIRKVRAFKIIRED